MSNHPADGAKIKRDMLPDMTYKCRAGALLMMTARLADGLGVQEIWAGKDLSLLSNPSLLLHPFPLTWRQTHIDINAILCFAAGGDGY